MCLPSGWAHLIEKMRSGGKSWRLPDSKDSKQLIKATLALAGVVILLRLRFITCEKTKINNERTIIS